MNIPSIFQGTPGNDNLCFTNGSDVYTFNIGDGQDTIYSFNSSNNPDTINFGTGISKANTVFSFNGRDLLISFVGSTDSILLSNVMMNGSSASNFVFADGANYNLNEIIYGLVPEIDGTEGDDSLFASSNYQKIYGYGGDDYIETKGWSW